MISIIIVSWNAKGYLLKCLSSLRYQKNPTEIIVVDNASADGSPEAVARDYPQVQLIRNRENLGFSRANNIGIKAAQGNYLAFVNSDVVVLPNCMEVLIDFLAAHRDVGMVGPKILGKDARLQPSCRSFPTLKTEFCRATALDRLLPARWDHSKVEPVDVLQGSFMVVKRKALEDVGLWDERFFVYGEDLDFCRRFWKSGWKIAFIPRARAIHYGGASSSNAPVRFYIEKQRAELQYWRKHRSPRAVRGYLLLSALHETLRALGYALPALLKESARYKMRRSVACLRWLLLSNADTRKPTQTREREMINENAT